MFGTSFLRHLHTYEKLRTMVSEEENIINSRPLTYVDTDNDDPLTPAHLLYGLLLFLMSPLVENDVT